MLAGAAVAGGGIAVLLYVLIGMLALDAAIPLPDGSWSEADYRFRRQVRQRRRRRQLSRLRGRGPDRLEVLDDRSGWVAVAPRWDLGIQPIDVESVTGTVEETKAKVFDSRFRADRSAGEQWKPLWMAVENRAALPPVSVYRVGDEHIVRDGHHRISVARDHGQQTIDAEVVELHGSPVLKN
jgi:hypothetical protein